MVESLKLIVCSFGASLGFGVVFRIEKKLLLWAGIGGAVTRCVYLFLTANIEQRFVYCVFAAMSAALFAECMAVWKKTPATVFLYPSVVPLIPGDLLYYTMVGIILKDGDMAKSYAWECVQALLGIGIGFVVISMVVYYKRKYIRVRLINLEKLKKKEEEKKPEENIG